VGHGDAQLRDGRQLASEVGERASTPCASSHAGLLVHARRTLLLPEQYRPLPFHTKRPFSAGVILVDGRAVGEWSVRDGHVVPTVCEALTARERSEVDADVAALHAFHSG